VVCCWLVCCVRRVATFGSWFGLKLSGDRLVAREVDIAVTWTRTLLRPTIGSRMSVMRWIVACSTCFT
jgi:hypothetical protein